MNIEYWILIIECWILNFAVSKHWILNIEYSRQWISNMVLGYSVFAALYIVRTWNQHDVELQLNIEQCT